MDKNKVLKWCCVGHGHNPLRFELLSAFLTEQGINNEFTSLDIAPADFSEEFKTVLASYDQVRVESPHGIGVYNYFKAHEALMAQIRAVDCVFKDHLSHWWSRSLTYKSLCESLQGVGEVIDLDASVLIVGAGASARAAIGACAKMGFKEFKITNKFDEQGQDLIREMKSSFFGLNFEFVAQNQLILLPGTNCIAINTTPLVESNDLLPELYYFNFLRRRGVIVDLTFYPVHTPLIKESLEIKNFIIYGYELAAISDTHWINWVSGRDVDVHQLKTFYRSELLKLQK